MIPGNDVRRTLIHTTNLKPLYRIWLCHNVTGEKRCVEQRCTDAGAARKFWENAKGAAAPWKPLSVERV